MNELIAAINKDLFAVIVAANLVSGIILKLVMLIGRAMFVKKPEYDYPTRKIDNPYPPNYPAIDYGATPAKPANNNASDAPTTQMFFPNDWGQR